MLRYQNKAIAELSQADWRIWHELVAANPAAVWQSPYFRPEFTQAIAQVRDDVELVLIYLNDELQGFLPYHRSKRWTAQPIAGYLSDYHGPLLSASARPALDLSQLLKCMQVQRFDYNHLPLAWAHAQQPNWRCSRSLIIDLSQGYAAYQAQLLAQRESGLLKKINTAKRKLAQKHGDLRFQVESLVHADFQALLDGKSQQYQRTVGSAHDIFAQAWIRQLMAQFFATSTPDFAGVLSTLHAGDKLIAAHFGLRSASTLHYWFPWYDTAYAEYSPGLILLADCAEAAAARGWQRIDLGRGEQAYKQRFATSSIELAEGIWSRPAALGKGLSALYQAKSDLRQSALGQQLRRWKTVLRP